MASSQDSFSSLGFITAIYSTDYVPFLIPHLHSIQKTHPYSEVLVVWQNLPDAQLQLLSAAFPNYRFLEAPSHLISSSNSSTDSQFKISFWRHAFDQQLICTPLIAFLDCDTLLVKSLELTCFHNTDIWLGTTTHPKDFDSGLLIGKNNDSQTLKLFLSQWEKQVTAKAQNLQNSDSLQNLHASALKEIFKDAQPSTDHSISITLEKQPVVCQSLDSSFFSFNSSDPFEDQTHLLHYRGDWHQRLLHQSLFEPSGTPSSLIPWLTHWRKNCSEAFSFFAKKLVVQSSQKALPAFKELAGDFEPRGILHSEMLSVCGFIDMLNADIIIESGRHRGQSTFMLARFFEKTDKQIISIEMARNENTDFSETRLAPFPNVELIYEDSFTAIPRLLEKYKDKKAAVLIDGPKGNMALDLIHKIMDNHHNVVAYFMHDTERKKVHRHRIEDNFFGCFFTDDYDYVHHFGFLDKPCQPKADEPLNEDSWRPYTKGFDTISSYGPTLAVIFPWRRTQIRPPKRKIKKALNKILKRIGIKSFDLYEHSS